MDDFEGIRQRIIKIQKEFNLKDTAFARICNISHTSIANIIKGKSSGFDVTIVARICKSLKINGHWVITGEGKMQSDQNYLNEESPLYQRNIEEGKSSIDLNKEFLDSKEISELKNHILMCSKEVVHLQSKIKDKEEIIDLLKQQLQRFKE